MKLYNKKETKPKNSSKVYNHKEDTIYPRKQVDILANLTSLFTPKFRKKNKFKGKDKDATDLLAKYFDLTLRSKVQIYGAIPLVVLCFGCYSIKLSLDNYKVYKANVEVKKANELSAADLQSTLDQISAKIEALKSESLNQDTNSQDAENSNQNLSKTKITKPVLTKEITALTAKNNMQYVEIIFASNIKNDTGAVNPSVPVTPPTNDTNGTTDGSVENDPNAPTDGSETPTDGTETPTEDTNSENNADENQEPSPSANNDLGGRLSFNSSGVNDRLLNYVQYASSSMLPSDSPNSNMDNLVEDLLGQLQNDNTDSEDKLADEKSKKELADLKNFKEALSNKLTTVLKNDGNTGYINECILLVAKGDSINAFNYIQSLYQNKSIKFNIKYASITRDKDYITNKPSMYIYDSKGLDKTAYVGVLIDISSATNAPLNWYNSLEKPTDISDIFN